MSKERAVIITCMTGPHILCALHTSVGLFLFAQRYSRTSIQIKTIGLTLLRITNFLKIIFIMKALLKVALCAFAAILAVASCTKTNENETISITNCKWVIVSQKITRTQNGESKTETRIPEIEVYFVLNEDGSGYYVEDNYVYDEFSISWKKTGNSYNVKCLVVESNEVYFDGTLSLQDKDIAKLVYEMDRKDVHSIIDNTLKRKDL